MIRSLLLTVFLAPATAFAQAADAAAPAGGASQFAGILPLVLIFFVFYFLLIKPQQKRLKEHQAMQASLKKGDEIVTGGGIVGRITKAGEGDTITVEIAKGVEVSVLKSTVNSLVGAVKPVAEPKKKSGNKNDNAVPSRDSIANDN